MTKFANSSKRLRWRIVAYWVATGIITAEFAFGGVMDILQLPPFFALLRRLGYPGYFSIILGIWKVLGAVTVLIPRFPRLKEWAYAGMFFTMTGAAVPHLAITDPAIMLIAPIGFAVLVVASWALRPSCRRELRSSSMAITQGRTIAYWVSTVLIAAECLIGGLMGALRLQPFVGIMDHLGYPRYFTIIIGVCYLLAGLALIPPRFALLKEWAYAGLIFVYTGAAASHLVAGDGAATSVAPVVLSGLAFTSWALRPPARRSPNIGFISTTSGADQKVFYGR